MKQLVFILISSLIFLVGCSGLSTDKNFDASNEAVDTPSHYLVPYSIEVNPSTVLPVGSFVSISPTGNFSGAFSYHTFPQLSIIHRNNGDNNASLIFTSLTEITSNIMVSIVDDNTNAVVELDVTINFMSESAYNQRVLHDIPLNISGILEGTQIHLNWQNPTDAGFSKTNIMRYINNPEIEPSTVGSLVYSGTNQSFIDSDLTPGVTYYYKLNSDYLDGGQSIARYITLTTSENGQSEEPSFHADSVPTFSYTIESSSVSFFWENPTQNTFSGVKLTQYTNAEDMEFDNNGEVLYEGENSQLSLTDLSFNTLYYFKIIAIYEDGSRSEPKTAVVLLTPDTYIYSPVENLSALASGNTVVLSWENPMGDDISSIQIEMYLNGSNIIGDGDIVYNGSSNNVTLTNLDYNTLYTFKATVLYEDGGMSPNTYVWIHLSPFNEPTNSPVNEPTNSPVSFFNASASGNRIDLTWDYPSNGNYTGVVVTQYNNSSDLQDDINGNIIYSGLDSAHTVTNLSYNTSYYFNIIVTYPDGHVSSKKTSYKRTDLPQPITQLIKTTSGNSLILDWINPTGDDFEKVRVMKYSNKLQMVFNSEGEILEEGRVNRFTVSNLEPDKEYYLGVVALYQNGAASEPVVTTANLNYQPISNLQFTPSHKQAHFSWTNPDQPHFTGVQIRKYPTEEDLTLDREGEIVYEGLSTEQTISNLSYNTDYYFSLTALYNNNGKSEYVEKKVRLYYPSVINLESMASGNSVILNWVNPVIDEFSHVTVIQYPRYGYIYDKYSDSKIVYEGIDTTYTDKNLEYDKHHLYRVIATYKDGETVTASISQFTEPTHPGAYNFSSTKEKRSITLTWDNPRLPEFSYVKVTQYELITYESSGGYDYTFPKDRRVIYEGTDSSITVEQLEFNTLYRYRILAYYSDGKKSEYSYTNQTIDTQNKLYPMASNLELTVSQNTIALTWKNPSAEDFSTILLTRYDSRYNADNNINGTILYEGGLDFYLDENLEYDRDYVYSIVALYEDGSSSKKLTEEKTTSPQNSSMPITNLTAEVDGRHVILEWQNPISSDLSSILVTRYNSDADRNTNTNGIVVYNGLEETVTDSHLDFETWYYYKIVAIYKNGDISKSVIKSAEIDRYYEIYPILSLTTTVSTKNNVIFRWKNPEGDSFSHARFVSYPSSAAKYSGINGTIIYEGTDTEFMHSNLEFDTSYYYNFYAVYKDGYASYSGETWEKTKTFDNSYPAPSNFKTDRTNQRITLSWTNPIDDELEYVTITRYTSYQNMLDNTDGSVVYEGLNESATEEWSTYSSYYFYKIVATYANEIKSNYASTWRLTPPYSDEFISVRGISISLTENGVTLNWINPDVTSFKNVRVTRFESYQDMIIYHNGTLIYEGSENAFIDETIDLEAVRNYYYRFDTIYDEDYLGTYTYNGVSTGH